MVFFEKKKKFNAVEKRNATLHICKDRQKVILKNRFCR